MRKRALNDVSVSRIIEWGAGGWRGVGRGMRVPGITVSSIVPRPSQKREISGNFRALKRFRQWRQISWNSARVRHDVSFLRPPDFYEP